MKKSASCCWKSGQAVQVKPFAIIDVIIKPPLHLPVHFLQDAIHLCCSFLDLLRHSHLGQQYPLHYKAWSTTIIQTKQQDLKGLDISLGLTPEDLYHVLRPRLFSMICPLLRERILSLYSLSVVILQCTAFLQSATLLYYSDSYLITHICFRVV